jgi:prepilin-type N-terminal cleavage/methylation domain-containing protein
MKKTAARHKTKPIVSRKKQKGFTLIELLIVIGILGILAAAILVALNPLEQFARGRDSGRVTTVNQLGHSVQTFFTSQNSVYPTQGVAWLTALQTSAELKSLPSNPTASGYTQGCYTANVAQNGICYQTNATDAIVYMRSEAQGNFVKAGCTAGQISWVVWSSAEGKAGLTCTAASTDPAIGVTGLK